MGCALINREGWGRGEDIVLYVGMASAAEDTLAHAGEDNSVSSKIVFRGALVKIWLHISCVGQQWEQWAIRPHHCSLQARGPNLNF